MSYDKCSSMSVEKNGEIFMSLKASNIFGPDVRFERVKVGTKREDLVRLGMDMVSGNIHPIPSANKGKLIWFEDMVRELYKPKWAAYQKKNGLEDDYFLKCKWVKDVLKKDLEFVDELHRLWATKDKRKGVITSSDSSYPYLVKARFKCGINPSEWSCYKSSAKVYNWFQAQNIMNRSEKYLLWTVET